MKVRLTKKKEVYNFSPPYIIAEIGANHNGKMELAKQMIVASKKAGANCVKFQSWSKGSVLSKIIYDENFQLDDDYRGRTDYTLKQTVEKFALSEKQLKELKNFSDKTKIDFSSSVFSEKEADEIVDQIKAPFVKIASMDLNNYPFLSYIAQKGKPMVISTGFGELFEIDKAVRTIEEAGNTQIVMLHCISNYPPKDAEINLNNINTLQKIYPYPIGFSDHTLGYSISLAAVAKGACIIEKHVTLDKNMFGWDHKYSASFDELEIICKESARIHKAIGSERIQCEESVERKSAFRRSVVAKRKLQTGHIIQPSDIVLKRPGRAISPEESKYVVGRKIKKPVSEDELIEWEDLS